MRISVSTRLSFGDGSECAHTDAGNLAVVHACKHPCHRQAVGYDNSLPSDHPHYLAIERPNHLYSNLIDPAAPLSMMKSFVTFLDFVDRHIDKCNVLIHCNRGESRSPTLALLYMAKRLNELPDDSYIIAAAAFRERFPYSPGNGIVSWMSKNWDRIT